MPEKGLPMNDSTYSRAIQSSLEKIKAGLPNVRDDDQLSELSNFLDLVAAAVESGDLTDLLLPSGGKAEAAVDSEPQYVAMSRRQREALSVAHKRPPAEVQRMLRSIGLA